MAGHLSTSGGPIIPQRVLITGGRDFSDGDLTAQALAYWVPLGATIVHGGARGADSLAGELWDGYGPVEVHPAQWALHGKAAGAIRNQEMLDSGVDMCLAFPGGKGTADMVRRCTKAAVKVVQVASDNRGALPQELAKDADK